MIGPGWLASMNAPKSSRIEAAVSTAAWATFIFSMAINPSGPDSAPIDRANRRLQ